MLVPSRVLARPQVWQIYLLLYLPVDLDLELRFRDQDTALRILKKPTQQAFLDGMVAGDVRLVGDSADMNKLQKLLKYL